MIAALFVQKNGCYFGLPEVDPWDQARDARLYGGPWPVVAHPPCERWGAYWHGGPSARVRKSLGDDDGCFASAIASVRRWGGVLEHPAGSAAWHAFELNAPPRSGGWIVADFLGGWTCCVEQGHYGHRARKATWLYAHGVQLPSLKWGPSVEKSELRSMATAEHRRAMRPPAGLQGAWRAARRAYLHERARRTGKVLLCPEMMSKRERAATPTLFSDLLRAIAESARTERAA